MAYGETREKAKTQVEALAFRALAMHREDFQLREYQASSRFSPNRLDIGEGLSGQWQLDVKVAFLGTSRQHKG